VTNIPYLPDGTINVDALQHQFPFPEDAVKALGAEIASLRDQVAIAAGFDTATPVAKEVRAVIDAALALPAAWATGERRRAMERLTDAFGEVSFAAKEDA